MRPTSSPGAMRAAAVGAEGVDLVALEDLPGLDGTAGLLAATGLAEKREGVKVDAGAERANGAAGEAVKSGAEAGEAPVVKRFGVKTLRGSPAGLSSTARRRKRSPGMRWARPLPTSRRTSWESDARCFLLRPRTWERPCSLVAT